MQHATCVRSLQMVIDQNTVCTKMKKKNREKINKCKLACILSSESRKKDKKILHIYGDCIATLYTLEIEWAHSFAFLNTQVNKEQLQTNTDTVRVSRVLVAFLVQ